MTKGKKILISIAAIISGWLLNGFAWTTSIGHSTNIILVILGLVLFLGGGALLIITLGGKKQVDK
jgi:hypothetical protein